MVESQSVDFDMEAREEEMAKEFYERNKDISEYKRQDITKHTGRQVSKNTANSGEN